MTKKEKSNLKQYKDGTFRASTELFYNRWLPIPRYFGIITKIKIEPKKKEIVVSFKG